MSDEGGPRQEFDYSDPRRYSSQEKRPHGSHAAPGGGAVISRKSGLGAALRRHGRKIGAEAQGAAAGQGAQAGQQQTYDESGFYGGGYRQQDYGAGRGYTQPSYQPQPSWQQEPSRRQRRPHGAHRGRNIALAIIAVLLALYALVCVPIDRKIAFSSEEGQGLSQQLSLHIPCTPYYVLALGSDAREGDTVSRSDTMILCRIDPILAKVTMISIPRDTKVEIAGYGTQKINAAYAFGGAAGAVQAVKQLTGVPISHVAVVHFEGIETLVDALGGVTVDVPVDVNDPGYTGLVMPAGTYEMDGHTAMLFSRVRHGFANGDYQRQEDQRILITAIMNKALSNPLALPKVGAAMGDLISTSMRCYDLIPLLMRFAVGGPTIYSASLPSTTQTIDGVSYVVADDAAVQAMMRVVDAGGDPTTVANGLQ